MSHIAQAAALHRQLRIILLYGKLCIWDKFEVNFALLLLGLLAACYTVLIGAPGQFSQMPTTTSQSVAQVFESFKHDEKREKEAKQVVPVQLEIEQSVEKSITHITRGSSEPTADKPPIF
ncbi:hypothetical protein HDU98_009320 [Podochytrium sp. JEL0797]|nr:hypothetical protein HDU98_009320 [Podochytrium sp. JEL0797]